MAGAVIGGSEVNADGPAKFKFERFSTGVAGANAAGALRVVIVTSGSRGEVQPYIAIAKGLQARGHNVSLATEARMQAYVEGFGVHYLPVAGDPTGLLFEKESQELLRDGNIMKVMQIAAKNEAPVFDDTLRDIARACEGADVVVSGQLVMTKTISAAEKHRAGWLPVLLGPSMPTSEFAPFLLTQRDLKFLNRALYDFIFWAIWKLAEEGKIKPWRANELGIPPLQGLFAHIEKYKFKVAVAIPECIIPNSKRPADWGENTCVCGPLFVPHTPEEGIPAALRAFVTSGEPPLFLGFGSMPAPDPLVLLRLAVHLTKTTNRRAVLAAGWSELSRYMAGADAAAEKNEVEIPSSLFITKEAPHDWLFPRCSALVIHCGLGTAYAALRAGVPIVPVPVMLDQPWVANRLHALGVAAAPVPFHELTLEKLEAVVSGVLKDAKVVQRAKEMAESVGRYDGVGAVCELVEEAAAHRPWPDPQCEHKQLRHLCKECNSTCTCQ